MQAKNAITRCRIPGHNARPWPLTTCSSTSKTCSPTCRCWRNTAFRVKVFFGAKQQEGRVPFKLLDAMLAAGRQRGAHQGHAQRQQRRRHAHRVLRRPPDRERAGRRDPHHLGRHRLRSAGRIPEGPGRRTASAPSPSPRSPSWRSAKARSARDQRGTSKTATPAVRKPHSDKLAPIIKQLHSLSGKPATRKKLAQTIANYFRHHGGALGR